MRDFLWDLLEIVGFLLSLVALAAVSFVMVRIIWYLGNLILP